MICTPPHMSRLTYMGLLITPQDPSQDSFLGPLSSFCVIRRPVPYEPIGGCFTNAIVG